jgi:hypothetical protein
MRVSHQDLLGLGDSLGAYESLGTTWVLTIDHTQKSVTHLLAVIALLDGGLELSVHHTLVKLQVFELLGKA